MQCSAWNQDVLWYSYQVARFSNDDPQQRINKNQWFEVWNVLGSQKGCKMMQSYLSFRCLRSDHLPFFPTQLWCGDASRLNQGQGLGTGCIGCPFCGLPKMPKYAGDSSWLFRFNWEQIAKKITCRWVKQQKFPEVHDVGWCCMRHSVFTSGCRRHSSSSESSLLEWWPNLKLQIHWAWKSQVQSPQHEIHPIHTKHESFLWHYRTVYEAYILLGLPYAVRILGWCIPLAWD